jgi:uncharacterized membrane protein YbaN (DUF454 family)|tara:strand:+ start:3290 stop:3691 length:402 start_codon:yes stop_codon:yes gene_type:complete
MGLHTVEPKTNGLHRLLWLVLGLVFTGIGIVGIIIPGLPTTIFMILAVGCFYRSSQRLYDWVINHKYFGEHVKRFREGRGMPKKAKLMAFLSMWTFVFFALLFGIPDQLIWAKIITSLAALTGTGYILQLPVS